MFSFLCFLKVKSCFSYHNFFLVFEIIVKHFLKVEHFRFAIYKGEHNDSRVLLKHCVFVKRVEHNLCVCIFLYINNNSQTFSVTFFFKVADAFKFFVFYKVSNLCDKSCFVYLVREFGDDNSLSARRCFFNFGLTSYQNAATACFVGVFNGSSSHNNSACWIVRGRDNFDKFVNVNVWIVDKRLHTIDNFCKVVWWNVCCHTNGNTISTIYEQVWKF